MNAYGTPFRDVSGENKMIIIGDGDMALNDVSAKEGPLANGFESFYCGFSI